MNMTIAPMSAADLELALDWAAAEGWNPGLDDGPAFRAADPGGFLMGKIEGLPAACISVVRHSDDHGFLGFYICAPAFRGRGHGYALWQAGLAHLGGRTIGLDGVVDQQENYRRSGFAPAYRNIRFEGRLEGRVTEGVREIGDASDVTLHALAREATGVAAQRYRAAWLAPAPTRHSLRLDGPDGLRAVGTVRRCRAGAKVGPLYAANETAARTLLAALAARFGGESLYIDVPEPQAGFTAWLTGAGFTPMFETARMYRGQPPAERGALVFGQGTLELG